MNHRSTLCIYMQVVTREAIYYGLQDSTYEASLVNSALPYAQRYLHTVHPDKYFQLKQSGFDILNHLQVVVVEELYYRNVIKVAGSESKKRVECSCLLKVCWYVKCSWLCAYLCVYMLLLLVYCKLI